MLVIFKSDKYIIRNYNMMSKFIHKPTGKIYNNRKEAKLDMGHTNYNKAVKNNEFIFPNEN